MAEAHKSSRSFSSAPIAEALHEVCLEVANGAARPTVYPVAEASFLVGTVPGCDLRIPGNDSPAALCLISRRPGAVNIRKLCPTQQVLLNGKPVNTSVLANGDRVKVGPVDIVVKMQAGSQLAKSEFAGMPDLAAARLQMQQQVQQFKDQVLRFEQDKQRAEAELARRKEELERPDPPAAESGTALARKEADLAKQKQELTAARQELADIRTQLYDRYRERRDRLAGLQESVNKAARKVQERKQQLESEILQSKQQLREELAQCAALEAQRAELKQAHQQLDEERRQHQASVAEFQAEAQRQQVAWQQREQKLAGERALLLENQERHKDDLLRFTRLRTELDDRTKQLEEREGEFEKRLEHLTADTKDMESQVAQLDEWHAKISAVGEKMAKQKAEQEQVSQQLAQRAAALEGQQAALAALRTRLEKMREDVRQQEQQLSEQRSRQESAEGELRQKQEEVNQLREELTGEKTLVEQERRMISERATVLDSAVAQLRQAQERLAVDESRISEQTQALDTSAAEQAEATSLLQARIAQYDELHKRLEAERDNLRERSTMLAQAEQARETLQEQLRRRSEELTGRQKAMQEQFARHDEEMAAIQERRDEIETLQQRHREELTAERQALEQRALELDAKQSEMVDRSRGLEQKQAELEEKHKALADESREFVEQRAKLDIDRRIAEEAAQQSKVALEAAKREAEALRQQLPELELRAGTALERLTHGREQMRDHLNEVHAYAGQCREELETLRAQVQAEAKRLQEQEQGLHRGQEEQRLAIAAFRQQLIDWQGQFADMKRLMAHDESRLEQRQSQVAEQTKQLGADTVRLAHQADKLQEKEREVSQKRADIDRHLGDMREWYRHKLRELAGISDSDEHDAPVVDANAPRRDILSLTGNVDPIDRKLGDLMRSLELIEADTLTALLVEARRQRRSLRQVLLASGAVTLYQMALIEAGNLDGLMLGPVRVVDRLRATAKETVYRVFDPRRGGEAILRLLAESEAANSEHAKDFRRCFKQTMLSHPNVAETLEVLDIAGRPAVLQELLAGLPGNDWPALTAVPGVWYRLMLQAAQALHAAHEVGLVHGHLQPTHLVLTGDGILKVSGFGEPAWLIGGELTNDAGGDLTALADMASAWCPATRNKTARDKALPRGLQSILDRLTSTGEDRISSAAALLDELEKAAAVVPVNPEAWDRLLRHVKDNAAPLAGLRQSA